VQYKFPCFLPLNLQYKRLYSSDSQQLTQIVFVVHFRTGDSFSLYGPPSWQIACMFFYQKKLKPTTTDQSLLTVVK